MACLWRLSQAKEKPCSAREHETPLINPEDFKNHKGFFPFTEKEKEEMSEKFLEGVLPISEDMKIIAFVGMTPNRTLVFLVELGK
jgi:hypothetical protein